MEHKLITGGEQYLPFARSRIKALQATGLPYASQKFEIDGASVAVRITPGHEYISLSGGVVGMRICINSIAFDPDFRQTGIGIDFGKKSLVRKNLYKVPFEAKDVSLTAQYVSPNGKIFFELKEYDPTQSGVTYKVVTKGLDGVSSSATIGFVPTYKRTYPGYDRDFVPLAGATCSKSPCVTYQVRLEGDWNTAGNPLTRGAYATKTDISSSQVGKDSNDEWVVNTKIFGRGEITQGVEQGSYLSNYHYFVSGARDSTSKGAGRVLIVSTKKDTYVMYLEQVQTTTVLNISYDLRAFTPEEAELNPHGGGEVGVGYVRATYKETSNLRVVLAKNSTNYAKTYLTAGEYHEIIVQVPYDATPNIVLVPDINTNDIPKIEYILAPDIDNDLCRCFVLKSQTTDTSANPIYKGYRELTLYEIDGAGVVTETLLYKTTSSSLLFSSSHEVAFAIDPTFTQSAIDRTFRRYSSEQRNKGEKGIGFTSGNISVCSMPSVPESLTVFECIKATGNKPAKYKLKHAAGDVWEAFFIIDGELHAENYGRTQMRRYSLKENDQEKPENMRLLGSYTLDGAAIVPLII